MFSVTLVIVGLQVGAVTADCVSVCSADEFVSFVCESVYLSLGLVVCAFAFTR